MRLEVSQERPGQRAAACHTGGSRDRQARRLQCLSDWPRFGAGIQYGFAEDPHRRADHAGQFPRGPGRQGRRTADPDRSAAIPGGAGQAEANLQRDEAQLENAKAQYERNKALYEQGVIAKQDLDTLQASFGNYEGTIAGDKAAIDSAKLNLIYCRITSPINGRVGLRQVDPGNYVTAAAGTPMLVITQLHPISLVFTLPEDQLQAVRSRCARVPLEVDVYSRDDQTKLSAGKLLTIDNQIDQPPEQCKLKAMFENPDNTLWPNQFVNVHLLLETHQERHHRSGERGATRAARDVHLRGRQQQHGADAAHPGRADARHHRW